MLISGIGSYFFYRPFYIFEEYFFDSGGGFFGFEFPDYVRVFDLAYAFILSLILSLFLRWRDAVNYWIGGYFLLVLLSLLFLGGLFFPNPFRLLFILASASIGFLIGQGIRLAVTRLAKLK